MSPERRSVELIDLKPRPGEAWATLEVVSVDAGHEGNYVRIVTKRLDTGHEVPIRLQRETALRIQAAELALRKRDDKARVAARRRKRA